MEFEPGFPKYQMWYRQAKTDPWQEKPNLDLSGAAEFYDDCDFDTKIGEVVILNTKGNTRPMTREDRMQILNLVYGE